MGPGDAFVVPFDIQLCDSIKEEGWNKGNFFRQWKALVVVAVAAAAVVVEIVYVFNGPVSHLFPSLQLVTKFRDKESTHVCVCVAVRPEIELNFLCFREDKKWVTTTSAVINLNIFLKQTKTAEYQNKKMLQRDHQATRQIDTYLYF